MVRKAAGGSRGRSRALPAGTLTLVFTDIAGSTRLLGQLGADYGELLARHRRTIRAVTSSHGGVPVDTEGDSTFAVFRKATDAVSAALEIMASRSEGPIRVRIGIHTGEPEATDEGYVGLDVHLAARICAAAQAGQILLSQTARDLIRAQVRDLGQYRIKDFNQPVRLFQLGQERFDLPRTPPVAHLPGRPTRLVGRTQELRELEDLSAVRQLITLTGPGGSGKTRLVLELADRIQDRYEDGVFFVDLAAIRDPGLVPSTIAGALSIRAEPSQTPLAAIVDRLSNRRVLLILDNLEQVLGAATYVAELVAQCPSVHVLATSRARLRIRGEHDYPVEPLPLPTGDELRSVEQVAQSDAVALFVERTRDSAPRFELTSINAADVGGICRRLDGLPLAIELAAARVKLLSPRALLSRLDQRLPLLTVGARDAPARQQTLHETVAWSYDLLSDQEQRVFARCSVFVGGFSLPAALTVASDPDEGTVVDVLAILDALVEHNLLRVIPTIGVEPRLTMLETIREFAWGQLTELQRATWQGRHLDYFVAAAEAEESRQRGIDQKAWVQRLVIDRENFRAALAYALARQDAPQLLRLATALERRFWLASGDLSLEENRHWLETALARGNEAPPRMRARALENIAWTEPSHGRQIEILQESLDLFKQAEDDLGAVGALSGLGHLSIYAGDYEAAGRWLERALELARRIRAAAPVLVEVLVPMGELAHRLGQHHAASKYLDEAVNHARQADDAWGLSFALGHVGRLAQEDSDWSRAVPALQESIEIAREIDDPEELAESIYDLSAAWIQAGDLEQARSLIRQGAATTLELFIGYRVMTLDAIADWLEAAHSYSPAIWTNAAATHTHAAWKSQDPHWEESRRRIVDRLRQAVSSQDFQDAWARGERMSIPEAIAAGLREMEAVNLNEMDRADSSPSAASVNA